MPDLPIYDSLTFDRLRKANVERAPHFTNAKGDLANCESWSLNDWFAALIGEVGEAANISKKIKRGDFSLAEVRDHFANELADVQIYLDLLAAKAGIDLGEATVKKFNKVSELQNINVMLSGAPSWLCHEEDWLGDDSVDINNYLKDYAEPSPHQIHASGGISSPSTYIVVGYIDMASGKWSHRIFTDQVEADAFSAQRQELEDKEESNGHL
ncbi:MAG: MazG-like family protein [Sneathiella sp.]